MKIVDEMTKNWDEMAKEDALWLICTDPTKKNNKWDVNEFFQTGLNEISVVLNYLSATGAEADFKGHALDFGCGVGRLSQALSQKFDKVTGVDISREMIKRADQLNKFKEKCTYRLNDATDLKQFPDSTFNFIYSSIVLQHVPKPLIAGYLNEFGRVLKPGGLLVFQLPDSFRTKSLSMKIKEALQIRILIKKFLRMFLKNSGSNYIEVNRFPESSVREIFPEPKFFIKDIKLTNSLKPDFNGKLEFLDTEPEEGYISKQYCVQKSVG